MRSVFGQWMVGSLVGLAGCLVVLAGCEESLGPVSGDWRPYSLYGFLNPAADTQAIRVFKVQSRLEPVPANPLQVTLTSTDLETRQTYVWRDSLIRLPGGTYRHVYWAPFRPVHGRSYRLDVCCDDEEKTSVIVTVVPRAEVLVGEPEILPGTTVKRWKVAWKNAPRLHQVQAQYHVRRVAGGHTTGHDTLTVDYADRVVREPDGWSVMLDLQADAQMLKKHASTGGVQVQLATITVTGFVADEHWSPPGGSFESAQMVWPWVLNNVHNGFGFVGSGYVAPAVLTPDDSLRGQLGL